MNIDIRKMEALMAVIETGSFELAAKRLNLTTSAISQRIKALESAIGKPLVIRGKPCASTEGGRKLVQYLRRQKFLYQEFESEFLGKENTKVKIRIAINQDSLDTWFLPAVQPVVQKKSILLDIIVDDQDYTLKSLAEGNVIAAISSIAKPMRGCDVVPLGAIRYRFLCNPDFYQRWFAHGVTREALQKAPLMIVGNKDKLQSDFLNRVFSVNQEACRYHCVPSAAAFYIAVQQGFGYGMISELQYADNLATGALVDISPGAYSDIDLYWHHWKVQSPCIDWLTRCLTAEACRYLARSPLPDEGLSSAVGI
ncbi:MULTISPECIES: LysR family transcriptional regulator ArgP [unclassified Brenneria]|uniref:LysR family transcriptional regulator ArgP n=1 Tax=unclassified Brenneria TaxID=2634434 RepID=UPI001552181B|nr:LysR family transcriptional regulator ArgP [Brenneria sp. L3-3C-1]MEE3644594.1 LysR family transcriptional regulator ArgP [Brenneria sp. L3_3C_1]MEE3652156.1 LysR family transcriptional regulator ArgP [Brenneria sp. HEZEL_4_2_4]NPD02115.1 LysR family transcriptional regulator ArgP [Brenneria sp. hezel4-2-4]